MEMRLPDIGDFSDVPVIEVHVAPGDQIAAEDPVVTLESDKATMDVPATEGGVVTEVRVSVGDTVSEGDVILTFDPAGAGAGAPTPAGDQQAAAAEAMAAGP
jgi:pyruvate/2-oxoglutarate dehydrogenase complex dihydrolipoamide acyltransferase (E2) component